MKNAGGVALKKNALWEIDMEAFIKLA